MGRFGLSGVFRVAGFLDQCVSEQVAKKLVWGSTYYELAAQSLRPRYLSVHGLIPPNRHLDTPVVKTVYKLNF